MRLKPHLQEVGEIYLGEVLVPCGYETFRPKKGLK